LSHLYINASFYRDRLGINIGKALKKRDGFSLAGIESSNYSPDDPVKIPTSYLFGKKTALLSHEYYKNQHFTKTGSGQT
jgi:hypothetical protein